MLNRILKNNKITQKEVAEILNVSQGVVSQWFTGYCLPSLILIPKLANAINCSIEELVIALIETQKNKNKTA